MFEIPRRGRQARNFECSENSRSLSGEHKTKETYPTRQGSPTPCKQALSGETCHGRACMLSGFKPVCLYSYHLFILLAVKTILYFGLRKRPLTKKPFSDKLLYFDRI